MKISEFHQQQRTAFRAHGLATPDLDSRLLMCFGCELSLEDFILYDDRAITPEQNVILQAFQKRRLAGEPVSRIMGRKEFWGREFLLGDETLDPRPDTETLIEAVLAQEQLGNKKDLRILDLGTGTGAILLTLLSEWPHARGVGVDKSLPALKVAQKNAQKFGCANRVDWLNGHWFEPVKGRFDLIVSNPPYIESKVIPQLAVEVSDYDPVLALDGGKDGLDAYHEIIQDIHSYLHHQGMVAFEFGEGQCSDVCELLADSGTGGGFSSFQSFQDLSGIERCILAKSRG